MLHTPFFPIFAIGANSIMYAENEFQALIYAASMLRLIKYAPRVRGYLSMYTAGIISLHQAFFTT